MIERNPRAPVLRSIAFHLPANASSVNSNSTLSSSNILVYCFTKAFLGCVKMF